MSLTHGHFYAALKIREKLTEYLKEVVENYPDAYYLGSVGPDILYWAGNFNYKIKLKNLLLHSLILPIDPHQVKTGTLIQNLLKHYINKREEANQSILEIEKKLLLKEQILKKQLQELLEKETKAATVDEKRTIEGQKDEINKEIKDLEEEKLVLGKTTEAFQELQTTLEKEKKASPEEKQTLENSRKQIEIKIKELEKERKRSLDEYLSFVLGWITHWTTDLYIHSLVDIYGGRYETEDDNFPGKSRHLQLELVETKYLWAKMPSLMSIALNNCESVWAHMSTPLTQTYPEAVIYDFNKTKCLPSERPFLFANTVLGGVSMLQQGIGSATEGCSKKDGDASSFFNQGAETQWANKGAFVPSNKIYEAILEPMKIVSAKAEKSGFELEVYIGDTGLYGKFLKEYDAFMNASIDKANSIMNAIESKISLKIFSKISSVKDVDILLPETQLRILAPSLMKAIRDSTIRDTLNRNKSEKHRVNFDFEYQVQYERRTHFEKTSYLTKDKIRIPWTYSEEINESKSNILYDSRSDIVRLSIQLNNPLSNNYSYWLRLSLSDENAFIKKKYPVIEFLEYSSTYDKGLIHCLYYDRNGNKEEEGDEINHLRCGHWFKYYSSGKKEEEGDYLDDKQTGLWNFYDHKGTIIKKGDYLEGKRSGHWTFYLENGGVTEEGDYQNDMKNGLWIRYFDNGEKTAEENYRNDLKHGHWIFYYDNGKKSQEGNYSDGFESGHWINYFESGVISQEGDVNGGRIDYYEDGGKSGEMSASGHWIGWFPNGIKKEEGNYSQGTMGRERSGQWVSYFESGSKAHVGEYLNDNPTGHWTYYYPNGNKKMEGICEESSEWSYWDEKGNKVKKECLGL